jgi:hypothetical protein
MFKNPIIRYSLLGSVLVIAYFALFYRMDKTLFIHPGIQWVSLLIYVAVMYAVARADVAANGADRDFRSLLRAPFIAFLLVNLAYWLFYYSLHLADPELVQMETAVQVAHLREQLSKGTGDPQQANQLREQLQAFEQSAPVMPLGPVLLRMALGSIGGFGLAAAVAALARR